jgi:membrane-associated phospholipid phosphatase
LKPGADERIGDRTLYAEKPASAVAPRAEQIRRLDWRWLISGVRGALRGAARALFRPSFLITLVSAMALAWAAYEWADRPLALWLRKFDTVFITSAFRYVTDLGKGAWLVGIAATGALLLWLLALIAPKRWAPTLFRRAGQAFFVFCCVSMPSMIGLAAKIVIGRARPKLFFADGTFGFFPMQWDADWHSMPSGHALATVGFAAGLALVLPAPGLPFVAFFATVIGFSRVLTTVHFLSDAISGAALGLLCAIVLKQMFLSAGADIFPEWDPNKRRKQKRARANA